MKSLITNQHTEKICWTRTVVRRLLGFALVLAALPAQAALFDQNDTSRLAAVIAEIQSFEDDVRTAVHHVPRNDAEAVESYAYVGLNLEAAHERLNSIFMLMAVAIFVDSSIDELLFLNVMHGQLLPRTKTYLAEKQDAIGSMAVAHPANEVFATYHGRAKTILSDHVIPLLDELDRRIGENKR